MTAQGNALGNKSATMTNALKGRNKMFNPPNGGNSFALSGLARFVSYGSQGVALVVLHKSRVLSGLGAECKPTMSEVMRPLKADPKCLWARRTLPLSVDIAA